MSNNIFYKKFFSSLAIGIFCLTAQATPRTTIRPAAHLETFSKRPAVSEFIQDMVKQYHFNRQKLHRLFDTVQPMPVILAKVKHPTEDLPWFQYEKIFLRPKRIQEGVKFWRKYHKTLNRAEKTYGVPAGIIVAIIAVESNYGKNLGKFRVLDALSNIAFSKSPRREFFKMQLAEFLLLCREKKINPETLLGSYAGAIGQPQFMPQSFRKYAIDFSHTGHIDLAHDEADVIGSIAKYLNMKGWKAHQKILLPVKPLSNNIPVVFNILKPTYSAKALKKYFTFNNLHFSEYEKLGVLKLQYKKGYQYKIGLHNFYVIMTYNEHIKYGMIVYALNRSIESIYYNKHPNVQKEHQSFSRIPLKQTILLR